MSVKNCEKLEKSMVALTVEVGAADFEAAVEKAYKKQRGKISLPGFRPGKAPRKMIESMYGVEVFYEDAVNIALPDAYMEAVKAQELDVVGYPEVELKEVGKDGFTFVAKVAVYPEVTLGQYKGLEAPKAEVKVMAADVNARLKEMADRNSRMVSVDRKVKKGDTANIDFEGFDNGVAFDGGKGENFDLEIGSGHFVPGFEEQLIGMTAGEEKDIDITFPEDYHAELAGKAVVFHVKVNAVKVKEVPAIDDEFAKDVSEFETLEALKADLKSKLQEKKDLEANDEFENKLVDAVIAGMKADIPACMYERKIDEMVQDFAYRLQMQGLNLETYMQYTGSTVESFRETFKEQAEHQVKVRLALEKIAELENLTATEEDLEEQFKKAAEVYGMELEKIKELLPADEISKDIAVNKAIDFVRENAVAPKAKKKTTRKSTAKKAKVEEEAAE